MGLKDLFKKQEIKNNNKPELEPPVVIYHGVQTKGYRGYKRYSMVIYNGDDFIGSDITISKVHYKTSMRGEKEYLLAVQVDGLKVGVFFESREGYYDILNKKIAGAYCKAEEELVNDKLRVKTRLLLKFEE